MSNRDYFTFDEWALIRSMPALVTAGVAASDPSGIIGVFTEAQAGEWEFDHFTGDHRGIELLESLADDKEFRPAPDLRSMLRHGDPAEAADFLRSVIARAVEALAIVRHRGTPEEAAAYGALLNSVAQHVADAAIEGGHFGVGGVRVSAKEQAFLDMLAAALAAPAAGTSVGTGTSVDSGTSVGADAPVAAGTAVGADAPVGAGTAVEPSTTPA
jgi:hypothetical protein